MRCPICSTPLRDDATVCDECGCGILPPPPKGTEPKPFLRKESAPRWPLVLSIIGVVAALAVIAVALLPIFDDDGSVTTGSDSTPALTTQPVPGPASTTTSPVATAAASTTTTTATTTTAVTTTAAASTTTKASTTTSTPATSTTSATSTTTTVVATTTTTTATATTVPTGGPGDPLPVPVPVSKVEATCVAEPSTDSRRNPITFDPSNVYDGVPDTAWRCPGPSKNVALLLTLEAPTTIQFVGGIPGYLSSDPYLGTDRWTQNRQVVVGRWACLDGAGLEVASVPQLFDVNDRSEQFMPVSDFENCSAVLFEILETSAARGRDYTAISELGLLA